MTPANTSVWEKAAPPTLAPKPDNSVYFCMFLALFEPLPQRWRSEQVSLSVAKSMSGLLGGTPGTSAALLLAQPAVGLGSLIPHGELLKLRYLFYFSTTIREYGASLICVSALLVGLKVASLYF
uniref:Uncharacterized protein n=1 Tax=Rousettus aegyptiacus TaxID=9407 RepID=A0A7J8F0L8_ROUAE|nr:hypothetical protein HJG63_012330 [Rousettus aegyptiacus]